MPNDQPVYAVIADDLTGAGDAGVQFATAGLRTRTLSDTWAEEHLRGAEVVVVDTASRNLAAAEAYRSVYEAAGRLQRAGSQIVYKKIDSTLRGAIGAETDAVLDACALSLAIVCPAYPTNGRTLVQGTLLVDGTPVAETAASTDPRTPVSQSHLPALLAEQTRRTVHLLARPATGQQGAQLPAQLAALCAGRRANGCIAVCDAQDDDDLAAIVLAAQAMDQAPLLVGSAGLARPLAALLAARRRPRVLVLCGSLHPAARAQLSHLQQANNGSVAILTTAEQIQSEQVEAAPLLSPAKTLAEQARRWLEAHSPCGIVVTGGDTLHALLHALEAHGVDLEQEVAAGIPAGRIAGGPWAGLSIISKAGGFGSPSALADAVQFLMPSILL
jgi:uncharacterized protein YgbK (DUF1537 family)